jgi:hypothetical protein
MGKYTINHGKIMGKYTMNGGIIQSTGILDHQKWM